jgi:hypothetical protein
MLKCRQCDFAIHEAVDLGLSVEEAEERNRPYVCAVGAGCQKRYRQMNGLKVSLVLSCPSSTNGSTITSTLASMANTVCE